MPKSQPTKLKVFLSVHAQVLSLLQDLGWQGHFFPSSLVHCHFTAVEHSPCNAAAKGNIKSQGRLNREGHFSTGLPLRLKEKWFTAAAVEVGAHSNGSTELQG